MSPIKSPPMAAAAMGPARMAPCEAGKGCEASEEWWCKCQTLTLTEPLIPLLGRLTTHIVRSCPSQQDSGEY